MPNGIASSSNGKKMWDRAWDITLKLIVPAVILLVSVVYAHDKKLEVIEATRFTAEDGAVMQQDFAVHLAASTEVNKQIIECLADLKEAIKEIQKELRDNRK